MKNVLKKLVTVIKTMFVPAEEPEHFHSWLEIGMTDSCGYGCKIIKCERCEQTEISHRRVYGCPLG